LLKYLKLTIMLLLSLLFSSSVTAQFNIARVVSATDDSVTIEFEWTAPGDDGNNGTASHYRMHYAASPDSLADTSMFWQCRAEPLMDSKVPDSAGSDQFHIATFPREEFYVAIITGDEIINWSLPSNIVWYKIGIGSVTIITWE